MRRRLAAIAVALGSVVAIAAGCGPGAPEALSDPRDILARTVRETAAVRSVTLGADLQIRDANNPGASGGSLEAQVDLQATEISARIVDATGRELGRFILVDKTMFTTTSNGRWNRTAVDESMMNPSLLLLGAGGSGNGPDYFAILTAAASEPAIRIALAGVEDCPTGRCYRTTVEVPPEALWPLLVKLSGIDQMPGMQPPAPALNELPLVSVSVLTDTATLRLVELAGGGSVRGTSAQAVIRLANHDAPVSISAPPDNLVDNGFGFGGGGFAPAPEPIPVEPIPFEPGAAPEPQPSE